MRFLKRAWFVVPLLAGLITLQSAMAQSSNAWIYIPLASAPAATPTPAPTPNPTNPTPPPAGSVVVNVPFFNTSIDTQAEFSQAAVFWFGQVRAETSYTDVRIGYSAGELVLYTMTFDKRLWYNASESGSTLEDWDALTLALDLDGSNNAQQPGGGSYRFVLQLRHWQQQQPVLAARYQAAYRGNGSGWERQNIPFNVFAAPAAQPVPNDTVDDRGWSATVRIPFSSLGLSGPPAEGTVWKLAVFLHDRDAEAGPALPVMNWPGGSLASNPAGWGRLRFGLPAYTAPPSTPGGTVTIRHGLNGEQVPDAMVGGGVLCGESLDLWTQWGDANYAGSIDSNIQNQMNLGDWPCFSKVYITFPLGSVPPGKVIRSARLVMNQFGGSDPTQANASTIQVFNVAGGWNESSITWNNAPAFLQNVSRLRVMVIADHNLAANREWDVSAAAAQAYQQGQPLYLALYSADGSLHSGKYFRSSDFNMPEYRPSLIIEWGNP